MVNNGVQFIICVGEYSKGGQVKYNSSNKITQRDNGVIKIEESLNSQILNFASLEKQNSRLINIGWVILHVLLFYTLFFYPVSSHLYLAVVSFPSKKKKKPCLYLQDFNT